MNRRLHALIKGNNPVEISQLYHIMDQLCMLRRSPASKIPLDGTGAVLELRDLMQPHTVKTVDAKFSEDEAYEFQWLHRLPARYTTFKHVWRCTLIHIIEST